MKPLTASWYVRVTKKIGKRKHQTDTYSTPLFLALCIPFLIRVYEVSTNHWERG